MRERNGEDPSGRGGTGGRGSRNRKWDLYHVRKQKKISIFNKRKKRKEKVKVGMEMEFIPNYPWKHLI